VRDLAAILRGEPVATPRARRLIEGDSTQRARLVGTYRMETGDSISVVMDGAVLVAHWREHFRGPLFPESAQDYFVPPANGTAHFRERNGRMELVIDNDLGATLVRAERASE